MARLDCAATGGLAWLEPALLERFPDNGEIVMDVFTDRLQTRVRLTPGNPRIALDD